MFLKRNTDFNELVVWWDENPNFVRESEADLAFFIHDYEKRGDYHIKFWTSTFDLVNSKMEEISSKFSATRRNSLRRGLENQALTYEYLDGSLINGELIHEVVEGYNSFAKFKGLREINDVFLNDMVINKKIVITFVKVFGKRVSCYIYYVGNDVARQYIKFNFNVDIDSKTSEQISALHIYKDVESFKNYSYRIYDFGGLYQEGQDTSKVDGIIKFKRSFGAEEVQIWKNVKVLTPRGQDAYEKFFKKRG